MSFYSRVVRWALPCLGRNCGHMLFNHKPQALAFASFCAFQAKLLLHIKSKVKNSFPSLLSLDFSSGAALRPQFEIGIKTA